MTTNTNTNTKRNENELGAIWLRESREGKKYYFGRITIGGVLHEFVMHKNNYKEVGSKQPDWRIYKNVPREQQQPTARTTTPVDAQAPVPASPHTVSSPAPASRGPTPRQAAAPAPRQPQVSMPANASSVPPVAATEAVTQESDQTL